jgi:hypothetical protein
LEKTNYLDDGDFTYKSKLCHASGTAYGDGCYQDNHGEGYGVDAGLLGIMPTSIIKTDKKEMKRLGNVVKFLEDFEVYSDNGIFHFGNIIINTRDSDDYLLSRGDYARMIILENKASEEEVRGLLENYGTSPDQEFC